MKNLFLLILLISLAGCDITKRKNFVVLIDNSTSVPAPVIERYISNIQETILANMGEQDKLTVQFIDACSQTRSERIYSFDLAEMVFTNKDDGINHQADSSQARLERYLHFVKGDIAKTILAKRNERKGCGGYTDIINALNEAKSLVEQKKSLSIAEKTLNSAQGNDTVEYETCVVIFSDMVNENKERTYSFTGFGKLNEEEVNAKVLQLKDQNKIPDLAGVKILVYGATSTKEAGAFAGKQIENVKIFWDLFFHSAGAEIKGYGYDTQLELKKYLASI